MDYEKVIASNGEALKPGDRIRIKTYPKGTAVGVVEVSATKLSIQNGVGKPALVVNVDGVLYGMSSKPVKLSKG